MHGGLRKNRAIMLRLPRQAHYQICDKLCARDTARLIETASQWSREDDPRRAALRACLADRVARARAVARNVVPGKTIASTLKFLEAVERRDWEITPTGRDGDCSGQLRKIIRSYQRRGGLKDGDDIVFLAGREYRFVHIVKLHFLEKGQKRVPQITFRGVGGPSKPLLYADADAECSCLFHIHYNHQIGDPRPKNVIQFSGLEFSNDSYPGHWRRNSIVCYHYPYPKIFRMNDCHVRALGCIHRRQDLIPTGTDADGHPGLDMEDLGVPTDVEYSSSSSSSSSEDSFFM